LFFPETENPEYPCDLLFGEYYLDELLMMDFEGLSDYLMSTEGATWKEQYLKSELGKKYPNILRNLGMILDIDGEDFRNKCGKKIDDELMQAVEAQSTSPLRFDCFFDYVNKLVWIPPKPEQLEETTFYLLDSTVDISQYFNVYP
jgi:hypothetical protein